MPDEDAAGTPERQEITVSDEPKSAAPEPEAESSLKVMPILVADQVVLFPHMIAPLIVSRESDAAAMDETLVRVKQIGVVATRRDTGEEAPQPQDLYDFGCTAQILKMLKVPDGTRRAIIQGISRMRVERVLQTEPFIMAEVRTLEPAEASDVEVDALVRTVRETFRTIVELSVDIPDEAAVQAANIPEPGKLADFIVSNVHLDQPQRQEILEALDVKQRLSRLHGLIAGELQVLELGQKIQTDARGEMEKAQREYFLRQQLEAIRRELGDEDDQEAAVRELREAIEQAEMPPAAREQAEKELRRLGRIPSASAEYTVARTYLDWLVQVPWSKSTVDVLNVTQAAAILDDDHYGLERVKGRILEYLAVLQLKPDMKGPILCLVGPPGVGKTSLGRSIARALGRKFVRMSLGGMRDEAEIRGHRRTYVGALPGRVIQGLAQVRTRNPVFMLDEIDKVGADFRGDPSSALLEVLDPEQNNTFRDHYLDVDFDLSHVMFITTANVLDTIPRALLDRMEVLRLPGYTHGEKLAIAERYLVRKQLAEHGLTRKQLRIPRATLSALVTRYTREAGLRNLEREIATLCRKRARSIAEGSEGAVTVAASDLPDYLGPPRFFDDIVERTTTPGVAAGLAWTPTGGEVLFIECAVMPGKGNLTLTGHLGEVMRESAQAALTCVKRLAPALGIAAESFDTRDLHVHVPAGQVPKDGPSAGTTIATAMASALTGRPVRHDLAMTGEITLQGKVLPIGGVKEKALAAGRARARVMLLPKRNEPDLLEVPDEIKARIEFIPVERIEQVLEHALLPAEGSADGGGRTPRRRRTPRGPATSRGKPGARK